MLSNSKHKFPIHKLMTSILAIIFAAISRILAAIKISDITAISNIINTCLTSLKTLREILVRRSPVISPPVISQPVSSSLPGYVIPIPDEESPPTSLYGRNKELEDLKKWILKENRRLVGISGIGGIGKSTLIIELVRQIKPDLDAYVGISLKNAPKIEDILEYLLNSLQKKNATHIQNTTEQQISSLLKILRDRRCLIVIDNAEKILSDGRIGQYQSGFESYEVLINKIGSLLHKSSLILIGQELPEQLGIAVDFCHLPLKGLKYDAGWNLFEEYYLARGEEPCYVAPEAEPDKEIIIDHYAGNPLMLKIAAASIHDFHYGDVSEFVARYLNCGMPLKEAIQQLLDLHFNRLSIYEWKVMYWLAIEREEVTLEDLQKNALSPEDEGRMKQAIELLVLKRSLVSRRDRNFFLPDVLMEYTIQHLIGKVCEEISGGEDFSILHNHAIIQARAKDYIREAQLRFILEPILHKLQKKFSNELENRLRQILFRQQSRFPVIFNSTYLVGNILNFFVKLKINLKSLNLSNSSIRQAYLRNVDLHEVDFTRSELSEVVFSDSYDCIHSIVFSPDGSFIATSEANGNIRLWRTSSNEQPFLTFEKKHEGQVWSLAFNSDGSRLASGGQDRNICLWDVKSGQHIKTFQSSKADIVRSISFHPNNQILASGGDDCCIKFWNLENSEYPFCIEINSCIYSLLFSPDGKVLAGGLQNGKIFLCRNFSDVCFLDCQSDLADVVYSVAFSPDGSKLASGGRDGYIRLWSIETNQTLLFSEKYSTRIRSVAFSPDGEKLVLGGDDRAIKLLNITTMQTQVMQGNGHTSRVRSVAFSPNGQLMVSGSDDHSVKIWHTNDTRCQKTFAGGLTNRFWSISLSCDWKRLAIGL